MYCRSLGPISISWYRKRPKMGKLRRMLSLEIQRSWMKSATRATSRIAKIAPPARAKIVGRLMGVDHTRPEVGCRRLTGHSISHHENSHFRDILWDRPRARGVGIGLWKQWETDP